MFNIVLLEPEIPENTGNIGRTCVCTNSKLHIIEPTKFRLTKEYIKRSGMDYWDRLDKYNYVNYIDFLCKNNLLNNVTVDKKIIDKYGYIIDNYNKDMKSEHKLYFATTKAHMTYCDVKFNDGDYIMFGRESAGIDEEILSLNEEYCIRIPMYNEERSLNLSNSVAIVLYEALRQQNFDNLKKTGNLHRLNYNK